jgi:hypothetical protein
MWNFRIIQVGDGEKAYFGIHEVFYDDKGNPIACTEKAVDVGADSKKGIAWVLKKMALGAKKPVLKYEMFEKMEKKSLKESKKKVNL